MELITIITPTLNSSKTIRQMIESIVNQNYAHWQHIIVDGVSRDNTIEIVKEYKNEYNGRLLIIQEPDNGIYDAINKGLKRASGPIIGIINADDWLHDGNVFEKVYATFSENNAGIVYGITRYVNNTGKFRDVGLSYEYLPEKMIPHPSCFLRKDVYKRIGLFNTKYKIAADYDLMLRAYKSNEIFKYVESVLTDFRIGGISTTSKQVEKEVLLVKLNNDLITIGKFRVKMIESIIKQAVRALKKVFL